MNSWSQRNVYVNVTWASGVTLMNCWSQRNVYVNVTWVSGVTVMNSGVKGMFM
jgi:hypothetical protein